MEVSRRLFLKIAGAATLGAGLTNSTWGQQTPPNSAAPLPPWLPPVPPFPYFTDRNAVIAEAERISNRLEQYIKDWFDGLVPAAIPNELLPPGTDTRAYNSQTMTLVRAEQISAEEQWGVRPAEEIDFGGLRGLFPDPHCTYSVVPNLFVPFGSKVIIEGEFPYCRFFDLQTTPSFHPEAYRYDGNTGVGEVPIVDADIDPLPGNWNPFRAWHYRHVTERRYRVTFEMAIGNPAELNPAFRPPYYRAAGTTRQAGAIMYQGAWGDPQYKPWGHGRGLWDIGSIWMRYYAPDNNKGALAGVPLPKVAYELPDGRRFFIRYDFTKWYEGVNRRKPVRWALPEDPRVVGGPTEGWVNQMGIFRSIATGLGRNLGGDQEYIRNLDKGVEARGEDVAAPGNFEPSATSCTYINYLSRGMSIDWGKVIVVTGKMPVTPATRNGEPLMMPAEARYWSITTYDNALPDENGFFGAAITSLMDDEIVLDAERRYIIAYSWGYTRPRNATAANGVTWKDWGPTGRQSFNIRWLSVHPEWSFSFAPNESNLGWRADWASAQYDKSLIGYNNRSGFLGAYQPQIHLLTKEEFEALGDARINPNSIPVWR